MAGCTIEELFSIRGKVAVVTGGSRGIGLMIARAYVENGARVYISSRKAEACEKAAAELCELGDSAALAGGGDSVALAGGGDSAALAGGGDSVASVACIALPADLSTEPGVKALAAQIAEREEAVHILVNNAGNVWAAPFEEFDEAAFERTMALNVKGVFHLTRELAPLLRAAGRPGDPARVINIGSIDGLHVPQFETYAYPISKAAVHHMTRVLAKRLGPDGITVNAIAPGFFPSKMTEFIMREHGEELVARCPLGRVGEAEDMAGAALYLASRAGAYVNGEVIRVDGGTIL